MEATDFSEAQKREAFVNFYQTTHHIPGDKNLRRFCRKVLQNLAIRITAIVTKFLISALSFFCFFLRCCQQFPQYNAKWLPFKMLEDATRIIDHTLVYDNSFYLQWQSSKVAKETYLWT